MDPSRRECEPLDQQDILINPSDILCPRISTFMNCLRIFDFGICAVFLRWLLFILEQMASSITDVELKVST